MADGNEVVKCFTRMVSERAPYESLSKDAFEFSYPLRGQRLQGMDKDGVSIAFNAQDDKAKLYDTTGKDSCRLLASSVLSGLTPPNMQWFHFAVPTMAHEEVPEDAKEWLQSSSRKVYKMIHAANYDAEAYEYFLDIIIAGMAGLFVELIPNEGLRFEFWPMESLFVKETTKKGRIDTVYRRVLMTASQMKEKFGDKVPDNVKNADYNDTKKHTVIHVIRPRMKGKKQAKGRYAKSMPFESLWVHKDTKMVMEESGFMEFPVIIPRWHKIPESDYAVGPFDDALPDVKTLNQVIKLMLTHADMAIAGMFVAKDDGVLNPNNIKVGPRRFLFAADPNNVKPLTTPGNFSIAGAEVQRLQTNIRRVMMSDQLQPQDGPTMTATEVHVRMQIVRQLLGPVYGRFQAEFLQPLLERVFGLALRNGYLGEAPESIGGMEFVPEYSSPLARAQRQEDVTILTQFEMALGQQAQVVGPEVLDLYDADAAAQRRADLLGVPPELMRKKREVQSIRDDRAKQQQQMAMMEQAAATPEG